jgi:hypothetical protein
MRARLSRLIDFSRPLFVQKQFRAGSRVFKPGDEFKWKHIGVERRRVIQLFDQNFIGHSDALELQLPAPEPSEVTETPVMEPDEILDGDTPEEELEPEPEPPAPVVMEPDGNKQASVDRQNLAYQNLLQSINKE